MDKYYILIMVGMLYFVYILGIVSIIIVGNGFYSWLVNRKLGQVTVLETIAISLSLGLTIITIYAYLADLIINITGFLPNTQFLILTVIPICVGITLKLGSIKRRLGKKEMLKDYFRSEFKRYLVKMQISFGNLKKMLKDKKNNTRYIIFGSVLTLAIFLMRIANPFTSSPAQFSYDPYYWIYNITNYTSKLAFDYPSLKSYPVGFIAINGFFLGFLQAEPFSIQYFFLKWLPFFNLFIFVFLLYLIHKRTSINPIFFIMIFLLSINQFLIFRFTTLLPSPFVVILFEIFILESLIPNFPRYIAYLTLGTTLVFHPISGVIVCSFVFIYKILQSGISYYNKIRNRNQETPNIAPTIIPLQIRQFLTNILFFLIPIGIMSLCLTIRWSTNWLNNYLWFFSSELNSSSVQMSTNVKSIFPAFVQILTAYPIINWDVLLYRIGWIFSWGNWIFPVTLVLLFIPKRKYLESNDKHKLVLFLRISLILTYGIFIFPGFGFLLNLIEVFPGGQSLSSVITGEFFRFASERLFEIATPMNAIFLVIVIEGWIHRVFSHSTNGKLHKPRLKEMACITIITSSLFVGLNLFYWPAYEYPYDSRYIDASLWFRDYLDQQDPGVQQIRYTREDPILLYPLSLVRTADRMCYPLSDYVSLSYIESTFVHNSTNTQKYLVISFNNLNETVSTDIKNEYITSIYKLYNNTLILILKFPV